MALTLIDTKPKEEKDDDVEKADEVRRHGMARNPVQRDVADVEVHVAGLNQNRTRIDLLERQLWWRHY